MPCVMGVNGSIALRQEFDIRFRYYVIIDASFVRNRLELVREIVAQDLVLFTRAEALKEINLCFEREEVKCRIVLFDQVDTPACAPKPSPQELLVKVKQTPAWTIFDANRHLGFSTDLSKSTFAAKTVAYDALQILVWLGFVEIYIHGLDLSDVNTSPRFYEDKEDKLSSNIDVNFANFIEPSFRGASHVLRKRGVHVYNLSPQSALEEDVFPKMHWRALEKKS
jgi:KDO transferase-3